MKIAFKVTVEIDYDMYSKLIEKGYVHWQIVHNVVDNVRYMLTNFLKHWYCAIQCIDVEVMEEGTDIQINKEELTYSSKNSNMISINRG